MTPARPVSVTTKSITAATPTATLVELAPEPEAKRVAIPSLQSPPAQEFLPLIIMYSDLLSDLEDVRIRAENRWRSLMEVKEADPDHPEMKNARMVVDSLIKIEKATIDELERSVKHHPLWAWISSTRGLGPKTVGRLLGRIGDPAARDTPSQLWAYCGLHVTLADHIERDTQQCIVGQDSPGGDPDLAWFDTHRAVVGVAPRRTKGQKANWSTEAKTRAYLVAESLIKAGKNPYRDIYDEGRLKYAERLHAAPCKQCKAQPGDPLRPGHQHARAMRLVMKAVLLDMWRVCKGLEPRHKEKEDV